MEPDAEERDTEDQPVWSRDRFTDSAPPWVLNKLRQEHVSLWKTYSSGVLRLLGWSSNQREHKTLGSAVARAFVVLGALRLEGLLQNRIICRIRYKHNAVSSCCCLQAHGFGPESAPAAQDSNPITLPDHIAHGSRLQMQTPAGRRLVGPFARWGRWSHQSGR